MPGPQPLRTIGLLIQYLGGFYCGSVIMGAYQAAQRHGARLVVVQETPEQLARSRLAWAHVDGWICVGCAGAEHLAAAGAAVVTLHSATPGLPGVQPDNRGGMAALVEHLIGHGHRRIAFIGHMENHDVAQRLAGYQDALARHGLPFDARLVLDTDDELGPGGRHAGQALLDAGLDMTAIAASTDMNALGAIEVLRAAGRRIPDDCAVVGFDDISVAQVADPPLTTVRQRFDHLAGMAVERLLARLADPRAQPESTLVPTMLITRRSCGCGGTPASADAAPAQPAAVWPASLAQELLELLVPQRVGAAQPAHGLFWPGLRTITDALDRAVAGQALPPAQAFEAAWDEAIALMADVEVLNRVVGTIERASARRLAAAAAGPQAAARVAGVLQSIRGALLEARIGHEHAQIRALDVILQINNEVSAAMLDHHTTDVPTLDWLAHTPAHWAYLGLWADHSAPSELTIAQRYTRQQPDAAALGTRVACEHFPPLPAAMTPGGDLIALVPLRSPRRAWGVLALDLVINTSVSWHSDPIGSWAHMLTTALERAALLADLAAQQQGLLQTYQREQVLSATLRASEERYALAASATNDGLWDWDLRSGRVYYSPRWKALLGCKGYEVGESTRDWFQRVHPEDLPALQRAIAQHHAGRSAHFEVELRMLYRGGEQRWMLCRGTTVYDTAGVPLRTAGSISDISQRKRFEQQLRHSALHDALTGLPNRALLLDRLGQAMRRARQAPGRRFALLFLDLDRFKTVNDSLGHQIGDGLLVGIAERLRRVTRAGDTVARLGGDEFVVLLESLAEGDDGSATAGRIEAALREPFHLGGHEIFTSASIGVLIGTGQYEQPEELLRDADTAMYRAKALGRGRHAVFSEGLHSAALARLQLENDLRRAIERQELTLRYQPVLALETRQIIGAEALVRWQHPTRGLVPPREFIPLAEESGLIEPIGRWVLRGACAQARAWHDQGQRHLTVSVNVSVCELAAPGFAETVAAALQSSGLPARALVLEMTERASSEHASSTGAAVERLQALGVQIAFDDFGSGASSLSGLRRFRVNQIKIDRSFIRDMASDAEDLAITEAIIAMARRLKIAVVAAGVEHEEQLELLRAQGCDAAQGYLISPPVAGEALLTLLELSGIAAMPVD